MLKFLNVIFIVVFSVSVSAQETEDRPEPKPVCSVKLRVKFLKTGKIGKIKRLTSSCKGGQFTDEESYWKGAIGASKKIEF